MNFVELYEQDLYGAKRCAIYFADRCKLLEQRIEQLDQLCRDMYKGFGTTLQKHLAKKL